MVLVYYKAKFETKIEDNMFSFRLTDFKFSYQPLFENTFNKTFITDFKKTPASYLNTWSFVGRILDKDDITLVKAGDYYDSGGYEMGFSRMPEKPYR